jgi:hypothetical protein
VQIWSALSASQWLAVWVAIFLGSSILLSLWQAARGLVLGIQWRGTALACLPRVRTAWTTALFVVLTVVAILSNQGAPEIVYKNF